MFLIFYSKIPDISFFEMETLTTARDVILPLIKGKAFILRVFPLK
jgi:hypothetical protein